MKLYTFFSPSHKIFFDKYLKPSLAGSQIEIIIKEIPQDCKTGRFMDGGWNLSMRRKLQYVIDSIKENKNQYFIHSDCDVYFFSSPLKELLQSLSSYDIAFQNNKDKSQPLCAGFFICKANERTLNFFQNCLININRFQHDQHAINELRHNIRYKILSDRFFCLGENWNEDTEVRLPKDCIMFHANWAVGIERKLRLMECAIKSKNVK